MKVGEFIEAPWLAGNTPVCPKCHLVMQVGGADYTAGTQAVSCYAGSISKPHARYTITIKLPRAELA